jgi:hypothetical protein
LGCQTDSWEAFLILLKRYSFWPESSQTAKFISDLMEYLRNGCYGSVTTPYSSLPVFLVLMPASFVQTKFISSFFESFWLGLQNNVFISKSESAQFIKSYFECASVVIDKFDDLETIISSIVDTPFKEILKAEKVFS